MTALLEVSQATMRFGERTIWSNLSFSVDAGEMLAIIGANGSGKSLLLRSILGIQPLAEGTIRFQGQEIRHGNREIGFIPQHRGEDHGLPLRANDLVRFGLDGHRLGLSLPSRSAISRVRRALVAVEASDLANQRIGNLSGGELQRVRVAQAMVGEPRLLLADEPLSALDLHHQAVISGLLDGERERRKLAVMFVTHDLNPIASQVTRVLYLAAGGYRFGTPEEVMQSSVLSELYGSPVEVLRVDGRTVVIGADGFQHHDHDHWGEH